MLINGKKLANKIKEDIKKKVSQMAFRPGLAVVLVGDDPASEIYVKAKEKVCKEVGFYSKKIALSANISQKKLLQEIDKLNNDSKIHGILVQLPLPFDSEGKLLFDEREAIQSIKPEKDVDCFHAVNVGKLALIKRSDDLDNFLAPCTPKGVVRLIESVFFSLNLGTKFDPVFQSQTKKLNFSIKSSASAINRKTLSNLSPSLAKKTIETYQAPRESFRGKKAVIVGRSNLVGKPLALMLLAKDATVTICHSKTKDLKKETKQADILIAAVGKPNLITSNMVKKGAIVVDVGINRTEKGLSGDVDFEKVKDVAGFITPVPGGVGPMTIACLLENTILLSSY